MGSPNQRFLCGNQKVQYGDKRVFSNRDMNDIVSPKILKSVAGPPGDLGTKIKKGELVQIIKSALAIKLMNVLLTIWLLHPVIIVTSLVLSIGVYSNSTTPFYSVPE